MKHVYVVGTADTKGTELAWLADRVAEAGASVRRVDVGTRLPTIPVDITAEEIASHHHDGSGAVLGGKDRGAAVSAMAKAFAKFLASRQDISGIIGIGGGGGTSIITTGMRALPYGMPKVMVSTLASGDVAAFVDISDIIMMPSVTDFAGLNQFSRMILHNAAQAIAGMVGSPYRKTEELRSVGLTMFGVTTECVTSIVDHIGGTHDCMVFHATGVGGRTMEKLVDDGVLTGVTTECVTSIVDHLGGSHDCMVFHATGVGGRTMEKLVDDGVLSGVIDITTTEVCDFLLGGVLPAAESRFDAIARTGIPYVGSAGALDMVNFWAPDTVPAAFAGRRFYHHNPNVTLMRTTPEECRLVGGWIGRKLSACTGPVRFLIPERGVSALDIDGGAFFDPEADAALFSAIEAAFEVSSTRRIERLPLHINDPAFAKAAAETFLSII